jgi:hypothetical protein
MSDPVERARDFQTRAEECLRVADIAWSDEVRDRYRALAEAYRALAETELANHPPPHDKSEQPLSDATGKSSRGPPARSPVTSGASEIGMPLSQDKATKEARAS